MFFVGPQLLHTISCNISAQKKHFLSRLGGSKPLGGLIFHFFFVFFFRIFLAGEGGEGEGGRGRVFFLFGLFFLLKTVFFF